MTYTNAIQFLYDLRLFGAKFGLENTQKLATLVGHPEKKLRFIHVAGTNGKGSTCAILESIYRTAGLRVGLFTSPHLVSFRERIQVDRHPIPENEVVQLVEGIKANLHHFDPAHHPTFFEALTVMALQYFAAQNCDLVIWETGLGGRLDATNIVTPLASVITNIALDHQQWLGDTLEKIAAEKAGIIKPHIPVITATTYPAALAVIEKIAADHHAPLIKISAPSRVFATPSLLGQHQKLNAALALATIDALQNKISVRRNSIESVLLTVSWPGRLQLLTRPSGQKILLDGAHNIAGAEALASAFKDLFPNTKPLLILGMLQDKDWQPMCRILLPLASRTLFVPVQSDRTAAPQMLADACISAYPTMNFRAFTSLSDALQHVTNEPLIVIAGSLYLIGEALELLQPDATLHSERELNEWTAPAAKSPHK